MLRGDIKCNEVAVSGGKVDDIDDTFFYPVIVKGGGWMGDRENRKILMSRRKWLKEEGLPYKSF